MKDLKDITSFSELTEFLYDEYNKMSDVYGVNMASPELVEFTEKSLMKYFKLYDKPFYKMAKRKLQLQEAIDTMPHGFIWKFFHYDLWQKVKNKLGLVNKKDKKVKEVKQEENKEEKISTLYPAVVEKSITPVVEEDN